jgi:putative RecB family exonuclease
VYSVAIEKLYGVKPPYGDYFMVGKKGSKPRLTGPHNLSYWTRERVTERFHEVEAQIQAGNFDPLPEPDKCGFCDVNYHCPVFTS